MSYIQSPFVLTRQRQYRLPAFPPAISPLQALVKTPRQRRDASGKLEAQQLRRHLLGRQAGARAERVYIHRIVSEMREQPCAVVGLRLEIGRPRSGGGCIAASAKPGELFEDVLGGLDELRPRLDQCVT